MLKATEQEALTFSLYPGRVLSAEELRALRAAAGVPAPGTGQQR